MFESKVERDGAASRMADQIYTLDAESLDEGSQPCSKIRAIVSSPRFIRFSIPNNIRSNHLKTFGKGGDHWIPSNSASTAVASMNQYNRLTFSRKQKMSPHIPCLNRLTLNGKTDLFNYVVEDEFSFIHVELTDFQAVFSLSANKPTPITNQ